MRLLALADRDALQTIMDAALSSPEGLPTFAYLRPPETGLAMVRGRMGGSGGPFNLGEMTITRCVVSTQDSATGARLDGISYVAGRDHDHASTAAKIDALCQDSAYGAAFRARVMTDLGMARDAELARRATKTAATKVDFFTMERGS